MSDPFTFRARFLAAAHRFARDERGTVTVEFVMVVPVLLVIFTSLLTYFDVLRSKTLSLKGNYAIADLVSRMSTVDQTYVNGIEDVFEFLTQAGPDASIRMTLFWCKKKCDNTAKRKLKVLGSFATDGRAKLTNATFKSNYNHLVPTMYLGEYLLLTETWAPYKPPFRTEWSGIPPSEMSDITVTKPRGPKIVFQ